MKHTCIALLLAGIFFACDNEDYSSIPYAPVDYEILPQEADKLIASTSFLTVTKKRYEKDRIGYGGLLIVHSLEPNLYYAFDLACPTEVKSNVRIVPDDSGITATCPQCGARFNIATGDRIYGFGNCENGVTKFTLRALQVINRTAPEGIRPYKVVN